MKVLRAAIATITQHDGINFLLTNRIPRRLATRFFGWFSRIEFPPVRALSIAVWRLFADLDLSDAREQHFRSLHDCFIRRLKDGARPIDPDPDILVSPCDAIVGASGRIDGMTVLQVKGSPYQLADLLGDADQAMPFRDGTYVTLRLTSSMYHRFHAPHDSTVEHVRHLWGDTWNVNSAALRRVERLFCRNERAAIRARLAHTGDVITLVPVAAILVAGIRLNSLPGDLRHIGREGVPLNIRLAKGEEMGWFQHGSTIIMFAPAGFTLAETVRTSERIRVGQPLMRLPTLPGPLRARQGSTVSRALDR